MPVVDVNIAGSPISVHYEVHGESVTTCTWTAVLLHGLGNSLAVTVPAFEPAFDHRAGWRRLYLDLPGMGGSHAPDWLSSTDDVLAIVRAAIDELAPGPIAFGGMSYGGYLAAGLAAEQPERVIGLALVAPMVYDRPTRTVPAHEVLRRDPGASDIELEDFLVVMTEQTIRRVRAEVEPANLEADGDALERIASNYAGTLRLSPLEGPLTCPVLVVVGRQDSVVGFNDQWREFGQWPRTTFAVVDTAGHLLHIEATAVHNALLAEWLRRVETSATTSSGGPTDSRTTAVRALPR